ncbi:MAG: PQQ-binding-like beta-propeller repeat protein [Verrucomicrobiae bacterium]|nr:PQQ-binding-like beta-propeller repeat protein [Verrucomicrobiae bacterium]
MKKNLLHTQLTILALLILLSCGKALCQIKPIKFYEGEWTQFGGPARNNICEETALLKNWNNNPPLMLWTVTNIGNGYSAPIFYRDKLWIAGDVGDDLVIFAMDVNGKLLWQAKNGNAWKGAYPGARASCTYSDGMIYHLNAHGRLACFDADSGKEIWSVNILEKFGGKNITWALSECVIVDENCVYATPGGKEALMAAFNKTNGTVVWKSAPLKLGLNSPPIHERLNSNNDEVDSASYASPIIFEYSKKRLIAGCSQRHIFLIDAKSGELLCTKPFQTRYLVIAAMPALINDSIFFTAPDAGGGTLYKIKNENEKIYLEKNWTTPLDTCHGGVVYLEGTLYGSFYRDEKGWGAVNASNGKLVSKITDLPMGSILYADKRLYLLSQEGIMALVEPAPDSFKIISQFNLRGKKTDVWTHPVIYKKRLYLRYHNIFSCFDIAE